MVRAMAAQLLGSPFVRLVFFKKHDVRGLGSDATSDTVDRTLFVVNLSPDTTSDDIHTLFGECGEIEAVQFGSLRGGAGITTGSSASFAAAGFVHVVFADKRALKRALRLGWDIGSPTGAVAAAFAAAAGRRGSHRRDGQQSVEDAGLPATTSTEGGLDVPRLQGSSDRGVQRWLSDYGASRPPAHELQAEVNAAIAAYDAERERQRAAAEALTNATDGEGWTTVTRVSRRNTNTAADGVTVKAARASHSRHAPKKRKRKTRTGAKQQVDFYRFQQREAKREDIAAWRKKFNDDEKRLARVRKENKFKPY